MAATAISTEGNKLSATAERFCRRFSFAEIQIATQDFADECHIGSGGFGKVYKGIINDGGETVAIKRLATDSRQGEEEFLAEIETLSKLRHINLVSLIGYCNENGEMILVYEYIARGTLADHLHKLSRSEGHSDNCSSLTWVQRLKICIGAGRALDYVHTGSSIIHRDVKSPNILLDENLTAKVSDFGLAKHLSTSNSKSHVSTLVKGSFGYLDPSYYTTGRLTKKSDTYAFGVVLLEVLSGIAAVDPRLGADGMNLAMWAQEKIGKGKIDQLVASDLKDEISTNCLKTFVRVAQTCLHHDPKQRPTMAQVVLQLEFALEQQERKAPAHKSSGFLPLSAFWSRGNRATTELTDKDQKQVNVLTQQQPPLYHANLISDAKIQVEKLEKDLRLFKAFLRNSTKCRKDERVRELAYQIHQVVYEAEDVADAFVAQATLTKSINYLVRAFKKPVELLSIAMEVQTVCRKVEGLKENFDFASLSVADEEPEAMFHLLFD